MSRHSGSELNATSSSAYHVLVRRDPLASKATICVKINIACIAIEFAAKPEIGDWGTLVLGEGGVARDRSSLAGGTARVKLGRNLVSRSDRWNIVHSALVTNIISFWGWAEAGVGGDAV